MINLASPTNGRRDAPREEARKQLDSASYDGAAEDFGIFTERLSAPLARALLDVAAVGNGRRVLDIGTGTGLAAIQAAHRAGDGAVVGVDHSPGMLRVAETKARGVTNVTFRQMDAEALEFPDGAFDRVVSLFALLHFPEPLAAVREMHRVLAPGGRVAIAVGSGPNLVSWQGISHAARRVIDICEETRGRLLRAPQALRTFMREEGCAPPVEAAEHGHGSVAGFLEAASFSRVRSSWRGYRVSLDAHDFWRLQVTYGAPERIFLGQLPPQRAAALREDFQRRCHAVQARGGRLLYQYGAMIFSAVKD